jgi:hypothetical protein
MTLVVGVVLMSSQALLNKSANPHPGEIWRAPHSGELAYAEHLERLVGL